jgi:uncharacterized protein (UPF0305 family)
LKIIPTLNKSKRSITSYQYKQKNILTNEKYLTSSINKVKNDDKEQKKPQNTTITEEFVKLITKLKETKLYFLPKSIQSKFICLLKIY